MRQYPQRNCADASDIHTGSRCLDSLNNELFFKNLLECLLLRLDTPDLQLAVAAGNNFEMDAPLSARVNFTCWISAVWLRSRLSLRRINVVRTRSASRSRDSSSITSGSFFLGALFPVETGDIGHERDLFLVEPQQFGIFYNIIGMGMVVRVGDERTDIVKEGGIFEKFAFIVAEIMQALLFCRIEEFEDKTCNGPGMHFIDPAGPAELEHAALAR